MRLRTKRKSPTPRTIHDRESVRNGETIKTVQFRDFTSDGVSYVTHNDRLQVIVSYILFYLLREVINELKA